MVDARTFREESRRLRSLIQEDPAARAIDFDFFERSSR